MRYIFGTFSIAGILAFLLVAYNNFAPIDISPEKIGDEFKNLTGDVKGEKQYVQIDGKLYEKNKRNVYSVDGVPTFVKKGKPLELKIAPKNSTLGAPIDPKIYKEALGLGEDDEFFKPRTSAEE